MANPQATALSLFSGVGGLDLGWELATGGRTVGYVERDAYAASQLLARMENEALEPAPVWCGSVEDMDIAPFLGVDWVIGGFPCQDISVAGRGEGIDGARSGLWSELLRAYSDSGARYLFAENVSAITVRGLDRVLHDLAGIGCAAEWLCLRASDVGAPHQRNRWFLLAERSVQAMGDPTRRGLREHGGSPGSSGHASQPGKKLAYAESQCERKPNHETRPDAWRAARSHTLWRSGGLGNTISPGLEVWAGEPRDDGPQFAAAERASDWPPNASDTAGWESVIAHAPHLAPAIEPGFRLLADGVAYVVDASRPDQLRCCGNGVVPLQAACALVELMRRIE